MIEKIIAATAVKVLDWASSKLGSLILTAYEKYQSRQEKKELEENKSKRKSLMIKLKDAKERGNVEKIKQIHSKLRNLDS